MKSTNRLIGDVGLIYLVMCFVYINPGVAGEAQAVMQSKKPSQQSPKVAKKKKMGRGESTPTPACSSMLGILKLPEALTFCFTRNAGILNNTL